MKLKVTLILMLIGLSLLIFSWYSSYPVSILTHYDYEYNNISSFYWLSIPILFIAFYIIILNTNKKYLHFLMAFLTVLLFYSKSFFNYRISSSDTHQFLGLIEQYILSDKLNPTLYRTYYQWPLFFILNKISVLITGLDIRLFSFILYSIMLFCMVFLIYVYSSNFFENSYFSVIVFFIILFYFFNFQWVPYTLCFIYFLLFLYFDKKDEKKEILLMMIFIYINMIYTQIIVPIFIIIYLLIMYMFNKKRRYLNLFIYTLVIYTLVQSYQIFFTNYVYNMKNLHFLEIQRASSRTLSGPTYKQPYIDVISQFFSRFVWFITSITTGLGFIILIIRRKLKKTDYSMLLTGMSFIPFLLISFKSYPSIFWRAIPISVIPFSLGASYLGESKLKKYFKNIFLIFLILFTFSMVHKTFFDKEVFILTEKEHHNANFLFDHINYDIRNRLLSHFRYMMYFRARTNENILLESDLRNFNQKINEYNYIVYSVGLGKSYLKENYSINKSYIEFEINRFHLIYNAGDVSYVFYKEPKRLF